ncbi:hypothetical protein [Streptomyces sp. NBC_00079]|uniref:hypothetical protein n=1 Tax=Streptomyces sp. NBC_00079 TaxID=2975644 RepID=UPI00324B055D
MPLPLAGRRGGDPVRWHPAARAGLSLDHAKGRIRWKTEPRSDSGGLPPESAIIGDALYERYGYDRLTTLDAKHPPKAA